MPRERRERRVVRRVDREQALERERRVLVVEELLVVQRGDALPQGDLLARRRRDLDLTLEVLQELLVAPSPIEDPVEPLERAQVRRLEGQDGLVASRRLGEIVLLVLVHLGQLREDVGALGAAPRFGAPLEELDQRIEVARALGDPRQRVARLGVPRIFGQHGGVEIARAGHVVQLRLEQLGGLGLPIAPLRGGDTPTSESASRSVASSGHC